MSTILKAISIITSEPTETLDDAIIDNTLLMVTLVQIPFTKRANRQAGMHISIFFIKIVSGSRVKNSLIAIRFKMLASTFIAPNPQSKEYIPQNFGRIRMHTIRDTALIA